MDFLDSIGMVLGGAGSALFGGITGLLGSALTSFTNVKMKRLQMEEDAQKSKFEIEKIKAESDARVVEAQVNLAVTQATVAGRIEEAEMSALAESYSSESNSVFDKSYMALLTSSKWTSWLAAPVSFLFALADFIRAVLRPALTIYLVAINSFIAISIYTILTHTSALSPTDAKFSAFMYDLLKVIVIAFVYLMNSAVSWWFCDRNVTKFLQDIYKHKR